MKFIGLDIGTTSICGVLLDARNRRIRSVTAANDSWIRTRKNCERIQDPARILAWVQRVLRKLAAGHQDISGIGVTGQMHGILYSDKNGRAASPLYTWQDARGSLRCSGTRTYAAELSRITGYPLAPGFGMVTHWYNLQNGLVPKSARALCTIHDFAVMHLCGRTVPVTDPTDAASLGAFDLREGCFDTRALNKAGIATSLLPGVVPSASRVGDWRGVPVHVALGDNQSSFLGSVRDVMHTLLLNIGTGGQVSAFSRTFVKAEGLDLRPFPGGGYLLVGALLCGGKAYALLEDFFRKTAAFFSLPAEGTDFYSRMNRVDPSQLADKINVDTRFAGTRQDPSIRGLIGKLSMDNFTPEHLIAGFLEGMTGELYDFYLRIPPKVRRNIRALAGSGNGLRMNPLLRSIISRRFGRRIRIPSHSEEAAVGAALTAAVGTGRFPDFHAAGSLIRYLG
jgi:sedoheptulokinase